MFSTSSRIHLDKSLDVTTKAILTIHSKDRIEGTCTQYKVNIFPKLQNIMNVELLHFSGCMNTFYFREPQRYRLVLIANDGLTQVTDERSMIFPPGEYSLDELIKILNKFCSVGNLNWYNSSIIFNHDPNTGRVVITCAPDPTVGLDTPGFKVSFFTPPENKVDDLIGFPSGWSVSEFFIEDSKAVQSVNQVCKSIYPKNIGIAFEELTSGNYSTSHTASKFTVPFSSCTGDGNCINWNSNNDFTQSVQVHAEGLSDLTIRIMDNETGSPVAGMGEHLMILQFTYLRSTH